MSVGQILLILWRRGWIIALTFLFSTFVALGILYFVPGRYDAVATASIDPGGLDPVAEAGQSSASAISLMQGNMIELVRSDRVALDVVRRLNLTANPRVQALYRASESFGRENIDDWMAAGLAKSVDPKFIFGTNVLSIKYKSGDPNQAALIANAFLAATIDGTIAMKAATGDQTARWFAPQLDEVRKELENARAVLESFQKKTNVVAPTGSGTDTQASTLMSITQDLTNNKAALTSLETRLASGATDLSIDPSDPDLQLVNGLKVKLTEAQTAVESVKTTLGANNPKIVAETANIAALRRQIAEATARMREHLKDRIATVKQQITALETAQAEAQKALIAAQAQRDRLIDLERDVAFRMDQLNTQEKMAAQAKLQSKLTFADIAVLDKAQPPIAPSFPKPMVVVPVGVGAGLTLGLILAMIAEMTDRRVRLPNDLEFASSAPLLGVIDASRRSVPRFSQRRLSPA